MDVDPLGHDMLHALKKEAAFFGLTSLEEECSRTAADVSSLSLHDHIPVEILSQAPKFCHKQGDGSVAKDFCQVWHPLALKGSLPEWVCATKLMRETSLKSVDVEHLILLAKKIRPSKIISDISARLLINCAIQEIKRHIDAHKLFPDVEKVDIRARKLSVRIANETQHQTIDTTDEKDCLGFVEVLLNSSFTGGELCAAQNGNSTVVNTDPLHYVAMHPDANWSVSPVTSGTRVSLVLGMYATTAAKVPTYSSGKVKYGYWGNLLESWDDDNGCPDEEIPHLISTATYICPEQATACRTNFHALFLNEECSLLSEDLHILKRKLRPMFPNRELVFHVQKLHIRTDDHRSMRADTEVSSSSHGKKVGFLGTLVVLNRSYFEGGTVHVTDADGVESDVDVRPDHWYAVAAGGASTVDRIISGNRLSLHYDIYDVTPEHDLLARQ